MTRCTLTRPGRNVWCKVITTRMASPDIFSAVPAQVAERRIEFDDQIRPELQDSQCNDQIHEGLLSNGCDSTREKHECENQVYSDSSGPGP